MSFKTTLRLDLGCLEQLYLSSFLDKNSLNAAERVCSQWMLAGAKAKVVFQENLVKTSKIISFPPARHPLEGVLCLLNGSSRSQPVADEEIEKRLQSVPFMLKRELLYELNLILRPSTPLTLEEAATKRRPLKAAIEGVVVKRFNILNGALQGEIAKNIAYYSKKFKTLKRDKKHIDPVQFGLTHAKKDIPCLIKSMNRISLLDHPCVYTQEGYSYSTVCLLSDCLKHFHEMDERLRLLITSRGDGASLFKMLSSLSRDLQQRIIILLNDPEAAIPEGVFFQVYHLFFPFSRKCDENALKKWGDALPAGCLEISKEEYTVARGVIPVNQSTFQPIDQALKIYHADMESLCFDFFTSYYVRNNELPPLHPNLKSTVFLGGLLLHKLYAQSSLGLRDLIDRLNTLWSPYDINVDNRIDAQIKRLSFHSKFELNGENRWESYSNFRMAVALVLDELLYKTCPNPKIRIINEMLDTLDTIILSKKTISIAQCISMDKSIQLLHRLSKKKEIDSYVCKYFLKDRDDLDWGNKHRYDDLNILRGILKDMLYKKLFH